ncbi:FmdE family protein [Geopsychrobacter electrodiphilus]|uniref:FmdE family protein n=1 Tax=Geopsychrobacter electrodiphilus TaxID=225196 RepID=UPI0012EB8888|nr:FmdE family protein [Geopsychrobacter electrodiphilus]
MAELPPQSLFVSLAAKHGHYCPMSTLGVRLGWAARRCIAGNLQSASYDAKTCAADGIRLALGTELLEVLDLNQHRLYCSDSSNTHWQIELKSTALALAASYRTLVTEPERECLLAQLRSADEDFLLKITSGEG